MHDLAPSPGTHRVELGPSPIELFRIFRMPVMTLAVGVLLLVIGLVTPSTGHNLATTLGACVLALSVLLIGWEAHDLEKPWVSWDVTSVTLGRRRKQPLTLAWADVKDVCLHESVGGRRRTPGRSWLYLEVRPIGWRGLDKVPDAAAYQSPNMNEDALGVPASAGARWRDQLDQTLRAAGIRLYVGVTSTREEDPRAIFRNPRGTKGGANPFAAR